MSIEQLSTDLEAAASLLVGRLKLRHVSVLESLELWPLIEEGRLVEGDQEQTVDVIDKCARSLDALLTTPMESTHLITRLRLALHATFCASISLALFVDDEKVSTLIVKKLLGRFVKTWNFFLGKIPSWFVQKYHWPRCLWSLVSEYFASDDQAIMCQCLIVVANLLKIYFPYSSETRVDSNLFAASQFDLRREPDLALFLLDGLDMDRYPLARKHALYICKQIVKFSSLNVETTLPECKDFEEDGSIRLFIWHPEQRDAWKKVWAQFTLLYEQIQEPQVHLIEPLLPLLRDFLEPHEQTEAWLGLSWWESILRRAFANDSVAVRKLVLEAILSLDVEQLPRLRNSVDFLFGPLLSLLDNSYLYASIDVSLMVSQFGDKMSRFYCHFIESFKDAVERRKCIQFYLEQVVSGIKSPNPVIFFLHALMVVEPSPILGDAELGLIVKLASNRSLLHNAKARKLVRWQLLHIFLNLADPSIVSYHAMSSTLHVLMEEQMPVIESNFFAKVVEWLDTNYAEGYLEQNLRMDISRYFSFCETKPQAELKVMAETISIMSVFTLHKAASFAECCKPAYEHMAQINGLQHSSVVASLLLFVSLNKAVRCATSDKADIVTSLSLTSRIFEWLSIVDDAILPKKVPGAECPLSSLDFASLEVLVEGQRVLVNAAIHDKENLLKYLDIKVHDLLERISYFVSILNQQRPESYQMQLAKISAFDLLTTCLDALCKLGHYHVDFFTDSSLPPIFDLEIEKPPGLTPSEADEWNKVIVSFVAAKWNLVAAISRFVGKSEQECPSIPTEETFSMCVDALELATHHAVPAILGCLKELANLAKISADLILKSVHIVTEMLEAHNDSPRWFDVYVGSFIEYMFQPALLARLDDLNQEGQAVRVAFNFITQSVGPKRRGLVTKLVACLFKFWSTTDGHASRNAYEADFVELLLFGPARDLADERLAETLTFKKIIKDGGNKQTEEVEYLALEHDYLVRVHVNTLLNHLDPSSASDRVFARNLVSRLIDRSLGVGVEKAELKHVFPNAILHRRRLRLWQAILVLFPVLFPTGDEQSGLEFVHIAPKLWQCCYKEPLPSTRYLIEWFLIKGYVQYPEQTFTLLIRLESADLPASQVISAMFVAMHVGLRLPPTYSGRAEYLNRALELLVAFFLHNSHIARVHAVFIFEMLWNVQGEAGSSKSALILLRISKFIREADHCKKFISKLQEDPVLVKFDPIANFDLQWIFCTFPALVGISANELITQSSFVAVLDVPGNVPFGEPAQLEPAWPEAPMEPAQPLTFKDFQQKIAMWDLAIFDQELGEYRKNEELDRRKKTLGEIIVVASLVDRIPNLGGLSRTCEVFGATCLTVASAKIVEHPDFKSTSMTSDKWLKIEVVSPEQVLEYLEGKKADGFRVLAVEQSAQSQSLVDYRFPERCVLVLGNEKEGVPPDVLHCVDDCIEIPQFGMIRSLNVHVTGSIVLWEARRQLLFARKAREGQC